MLSLLLLGYRNGHNANNGWLPETLLPASVDRNIDAFQAVMPADCDCLHLCSLAGPVQDSEGDVSLDPEESRDEGQDSEEQAGLSENHLPSISFTLATMASLPSPEYLKISSAVLPDLGMRLGTIHWTRAP